MKSPSSRKTQQESAQKGDEAHYKQQAQDKHQGGKPKQTQIKRESSAAGEGSIERLMVAVIHPNDANSTIKAFNLLGFDVTRLASTGAFLDQRNVTLLIGMRGDQISTAMGVIEDHCHERLEHVPTPVESSTLVIPTTLPIPVGGATIFLIPVERHERIK